MWFSFLIFYFINCLVSYFWFYDVFKGDREGKLNKIENAQVLATAIFHPILYGIMLISIIHKLLTNH